MSDSTEVLDGVDDVAVDVEQDESDELDRLAEYLDERLAETTARLDAQDERDDALSSLIRSVRETAEDAQDRAERAERLQAYGGLGYDERLAAVVESLVRRAERGRMGDGRATIRTTTRTVEDEQGNRVERTGVVDLFDGSISARTCRTYIRDLGDLVGLSVREPSRGGSGGGSEPLGLRLDLVEFTETYGVEWDVEDLLDDMGGDA